MTGFALTTWQAAGLALVCVIIGMVVGTYLKRAEKPDQKRKNDK
jgi:uncharacterized membrane-anchored protein YhcB (DUF1043 family)